MCTAKQHTVHHAYPSHKRNCHPNFGSEKKKGISMRLPDRGPLQYGDLGLVRTYRDTKNEFVGV